MNRQRLEPSLPLRGPIAISATLVAILLPILQQFSWTALAQATFLAAACVLAVYDSLCFALFHFRNYFRKTLNRVVLDDVLCAIFHPETGVISICLATFFGNAAMYVLPTTPEQRVHLVQHAMEWAEDDSFDAQRMLREPGGFVQLFPQVVQKWLRGGDDVVQIQCPPENNILLSKEKYSNKQEPYVSIRDEEAESESTSSELSSATSPAVNDHQSTPLKNDNKDHIARQKRRKPSTTANSTPNPVATHEAPSPFDIMVSIFQDLSKSHTRKVLQGVVKLLDSVPDGTLQVTCAASAAFLFTQLRYSRIARRALWTSLQASASVCGSATFLVSSLVLIAKYRLPVSPSRDLSGQSTMRVIVKELWSRLCSKAGCPANLRRWQGLLAALVLIFYGRTPRR